MTVAAARPEQQAARTTRGFIDCDVHNVLSGPEALRPYLPERWHARTFGSERLGRQGVAYPQSRPRHHGFRPDARPPSGGTPGTDFAFLKKDYLDTWPVEKAILVPVDGIITWPKSGALAGALASALNDWMVAEWLGRDDRIYGAIAIPMEDGPRAEAEIARMSANPRFVQVEMNIYTRDPMGSARYWPIYRAAVAAGLPISIHVGGENGVPITSAGWPTYHYEMHATYSQAFQAQVVSLIGSGVFEELPELKIVLVEGGFSWIGPLMWRLDRLWRLMGASATGLERKPSELIREHFWFTTQPVDQPEDPAEYLQLFEHLDHLGMADRVMFSTDYPHWDFDSPEKALPGILTSDLRDRIYRRNAEALFRFEGTSRS